MSTPQRGRGGARGNRRSRRQGGRQGRSGNAEDAVIARHEQLALVAGGTGFSSNTVPIVPQMFPGVLAIARQYTEFRFTRFSVIVQSGASSAAAGTRWVAFSFVAPSTLTNDALTISTLAGYRTSSIHAEMPTRSRLPRNANQQRFYPMSQTPLSGTQLNDPNLVQAWMIYGTTNNNPAQILYVNVAYTVVLKGPTHGNTQGIPAFANSLAASITMPEPYISEEDEDSIEGL